MTKRKTQLIIKSYWYNPDKDLENGKEGGEVERKTDLNPEVEQRTDKKIIDVYRSDGMEASLHDSLLSNDN